MKRCFDLAALYKGTVKSNPLVGALIVQANRIIGEGAHEVYGSAHAEVNAVSQIADPDQLAQSALFVSLEPCFHQGKTPPCVQLILQKQIPEVFLSCADPFEKVAGKSIELLKEKAVSVHLNIENELGSDLIRPFVRGVVSKRPYIVLKYAQSADLKIGLPDQQVWLSNAFSKILVHKWRSEVDAVMVGTKTAVLDNPKLDNRLYFGKKQITRVVIDRDLCIPASHHLYDGSSPTIVLTEKERSDADNIAYYRCDFGDQYLQNFLHHLYSQEIGVLMVEGGAQLLQSFIDTNMWDEARVFTVPKILGDDAVAAPTLQNAVLVKKQHILEDELCQYYNKSCL